MNQIRSFKSIIDKLKYVIPDEEKTKGIFLIIMIIIGSMLETLGVSAILPFIEALLTPSEIANKWYIKPIIENLNITDTNNIIIFVGISIIFVYFIKNLYLYLVTISQTIYRSRIQKKLSTEILKAYMERPYEYFINLNTAEVIRGIGTDVSGVYNILDNLFRLLGEIITALLISIFIIWTDAFMALCIIGIAGFCFLFLTIGLKRKTKYLGERKRIADTARGKSALQAIMGFKEIKVSQTTEYFTSAYDEAYEKQRVADIKNDFISNLPERLIEFICVATLIVVICIKVQLGTDLSLFIPKLAAFALAAFRLLPSVSRMTRYMNGIVFNNAFLNSAYNNLKEIEICEKSYEKKNGICRGMSVEHFCNELVLSGITWRYPGSEKKILNNLSLTIKRGDAIGIVGASGAGKTTLVDIILGLLKPADGSILMDGVDIYKIPKQWSRIIAYVPQSVFLLDDTIRNNVAFGYPQNEIDENAVWRALKEAQLDSFIKELPDGLDTQVGERGIKFSGGQRQRVAIARALYSNPDIIVLDEATSALDNETEKAVMEAIDTLQGKKTLIIVAHRLSTIKNCDYVYEVSGGKIDLIKKEN